jgi:epoxyqueuosine reductase
MSKAKHTFTPDPAQMALWPTVSGNTINGLGEATAERPRPIYWHDPNSTPHGPLQRWFYARSADNPVLASARAQRQAILDTPLAPLAQQTVALQDWEWVAKLQQAATELGADLFGITPMRGEWIFEGHTVTQRWIIMIGVAHSFDAMKTAPASHAAAEVVRQYGRGSRIAKGIASLIREHGHEAQPHGGPMAGPMVLIPPALACGFGELGKHGSIINRQFGSSFRLACVLTDIPLVADRSDTFGADDFCVNCRVCVDACPPDAIFASKQLVRGAQKWYVDFDKCLPYFNETMGCGICVVTCPWSRPGVALNLVEKMAARRPSKLLVERSSP